MEDDDLTLSAATQAALAEFLAEKQVKETEELHDENEGPISIDSFPEDWQVNYILQLSPFPSHPSQYLRTR